MLLKFRDARKVLRLTAKGGSALARTCARVRGMAVVGCRENDIGDEVKERLRAEWSRLGELNVAGADSTGFEV